MNKYRTFLLFFLICSIAGISTVVIREKIQSPFSLSLAPLFQELGKPVKSADRVVSRLLPLDQIDEKMLGEEIKLRFAQMEASQSPDEKATTLYLNSLIQSLSSETTGSFEYRVFLVAGPPNAFAMPGGALCITKGMMEMLANEAELVAILGHEMGHVERGHLFDACRQEMLNRKLSVISPIIYATNVLTNLAKISFSKSQETEADEYGFRMLVKKGYDPAAMSTAFEKLLQTHLQQETKVTNPLNDFLCTHPYTELRIETFRSRAALWAKYHPDEKRHLGENSFKHRQVMKKKQT